MGKGVRIEFLRLRESGIKNTKQQKCSKPLYFCNILYEKLAKLKGADVPSVPDD